MGPLLSDYEIVKDVNGVERTTGRQIELDPSDKAAHAKHGWSLIVQGKRSEGLRYLSIAEQLEPENSELDILVIAYASAGQRSEALRTMTRLVEYAEDHVISRWRMLQVHAAIGDRQKVMSHLLGAIDSPIVGIDNLYSLLVKANSYRIPLLDEPAFVEARDRITLRIDR